MKTTKMESIKDATWLIWEAKAKEKEGKQKYTLIVRRGGADEQLVKEKYNVASRLFFFWIE